jgi:mono/diheme cytochrome c family protein
MMPRNWNLWGVIGLFVLGLSGCGNPVAKEGKALYAYYCTHCHGPKGNGEGFNAMNLDPKPRDHTDGNEAYMAGRTNEELFEAVSKGGAAISKSPYMPPFGAVLSEREIWMLVTHLRTLHKNDKPKVEIPAEAKAERPKFPRIMKVDLALPVEEVEVGEEPPSPDEVKERVVRTGKRLFEEKYGCVSCHSVDGTGGAVGPSLSRAGFRLRPDYIYKWIKNPQAIKADTKMPNFQLRDRDALAITYYLGTLKAPAEGPPEERGGRP